MPTELEDVQKQTAAANRILTDLGLAVGVTSALGHASMRVPSEPNKFVVKGREYELDALSEMQAGDMVVCDTDRAIEQFYHRPASLTGQRWRRIM